MKEADASDQKLPKGKINKNSYLSILNVSSFFSIFFVELFRFLIAFREEEVTVLGAILMKS